MDRRPLGSTSIDVPVIGMGTWRTFDTEEDRRPLVDVAFESGIDLFDGLGRSHLRRFPARRPGRGEGRPGHALRAGDGVAWGIFPVAIKTACHLQGICEPWCAAPVQSLDDQLEAKLRDRLKAWGLVR